MIQYNHFMINKTLFLLTFFVLIPTSYSQSILKNRIREIGAEKKSVYLQSGTFHGGKLVNSAALKGIRHAYKSDTQVERIVIDLEGVNLPRTYGYLNSSEKKLYLDLFNTQIDPKFAGFGGSKFVQNVDIIKAGTSNISLEIAFKSQLTADIFYLENPARLVVDLKP